MELYKRHEFCEGYSSTFSLSTQSGSLVHLFCLYVILVSFIKEPHTHIRYDRRVHDCVSHLSFYLMVFDKIFFQMASRLVAKVSHK